MSRVSTAIVLAMFVLAGRVFAQERQSLALVPAQPVRSGDVTATGRAVPQATVRIGSRLAAYIVDWGKNEEGELLDVGMPVTKGQRLFSIDPTTFQAKVDSAQAALGSAKAALDNLKAPTRKERLDALKATLAELKARLKDRRKDEERYRRLVEVDKTMPVKSLEAVQLEVEVLESQRQAAQARLDEAVAGPTKTEIALAEARVKEAQAALDSATIDLNAVAVTAPFDGVITRRMKSAGDYVSGAPLVEVLELTTTHLLEADLRLPEPYFAYVVPGKTRVQLRSPLMKTVLDLPVTRVVPDIDTQQGTFAIRVAIPPEQRNGLIPGAFMTASLSLGEQTEGVIVPLRAVLTDGGKTFVMAASDGKMQRREVQLGDHLTEGVVVRSGLKAGEDVVVGPAEQLKDGASIPENTPRQGK